MVNDGQRLFHEGLRTDDEILAFQRELMKTLRDRRDASLLLSEWLSDLSEALIEPLSAVCRTLQDEGEILSAFIERTITGDCQEMTLGTFAGQGAGIDSLKLSTLHSSKGREFAIVFMFGIDDGRIPFSNPTAKQAVEARRLFYVGFTRAESELHLVFQNIGLRALSQKLRTGLLNERALRSTSTCPPMRLRCECNPTRSRPPCRSTGGMVGIRAICCHSVAATPMHGGSEGFEPGSDLLRDFADPAPACPPSDLPVNLTNAETGRCSQRPDLLHQPEREEAVGPDAFRTWPPLSCRQ